MSRLRLGRRGISVRQAMRLPTIWAPVFSPADDILSNIRQKTRWCSRSGGSAMCDYSLHNVATRPAKVGDKLVTMEFWTTMTRGFAAIGEPKVAVCLLPGTEVAFEANVRREVTG